MNGFVLLAFKVDWRCFRAREVYEFTPGVNILAGDQGAGKSTMLELLRSTGASEAIRRAYWRSIRLTKAEVEEKVLLLHDGRFALAGYDFERDAGRMAAEIQLHDVGAQLDGMKSSHGEASMRHLRSMLRAATESPVPFCVVLDEPDANLSVRSCYEVVRIFRQLVQLGCQVITAVHNPIVLVGTIPGDDTPGWGELISLEHKRRMPPAEFLLTQTKPAERPDQKAEKRPDEKAEKRPDVKAEKRPDEKAEKRPDEKAEKRPDEKKRQKKTDEKE